VSADPPGGAPTPAALRVAVRTLVRPALALPLPHRMRRLWFELLGRLARVPEGVTIGEMRLGGAPAERIDPPDRDRGSVLYLHGGGYVFGSPRSNRSITTALALASRVAVHAVDYRLAPEHPFPAALEDAVSAYRALVDRSPDQPVALAGDSAGGGLALAVALRARDDRLPPPAALFLICPLLDLESAGSAAGLDADLALPRVFLERSSKDYLAGHDPRDPLASPALADLSGLPPIVIHAAAGDILRPEAETLADRARAAGTEVELRIFDDLWHDFHAQAGALPAADAAIEAAGDFIRTALRGLSPLCPRVCHARSAGSRNETAWEGS
jgi:epsilon-lactone hydrolase